MLVIAAETGSLPGGQLRWAGRRHDDDRPDASSGTSPTGLFDAVFAALHDGEQVAIGFGCPLTLPADPGAADDAATLLTLAAPTAARPGIAELGRLLTDLGTWRPWTTVSTSLPRWRANTSVLVWQAVPADGLGPVAPVSAVDSFFRRLTAAGPPVARPAAANRRPLASRPETEDEFTTGPGVNLAAAAARRAGLFVAEDELPRQPLSVTVVAG